MTNGFANATKGAMHSESEHSVQRKKSRFYVDCPVILVLDVFSVALLSVQALSLSASTGTERCRLAQNFGLSLYLPSTAVP